jgi:hypothetical protein
VLRHARLSALEHERQSVREVFLLNEDLWVSARSSEHLQIIASITAFLNSLHTFDWCEPVKPLAIDHVAGGACRFPCLRSATAAGGSSRRCRRL